MSRIPRALLLGVLLVPATSSVAVAQTPGHVRVVTGSARILRWLQAPATDVLLNAEEGTTLEVLDQEGDWYWVVVPRDAHGTRRVGWIRASNVEPVQLLTAAKASSQGQRSESELVARVAPEASTVPATPTAADDKVTITERRDVTAPGSTNAAAASKTYAFDDVHFDRDRYSIRPEDLDVLRAAATALKADPSLVVNIEGYTCSLGTTAHNHALGVRRADAVRAYLLSEGVSADRLYTISRGEEHAKHDNSREETRRLNRRVALVPNAER